MVRVPKMAHPVEDAPVLVHHQSYDSTGSVCRPADSPGDIDAKDAQLSTPPIAHSNPVPTSLLKRYNLAYAVTTFGVSRTDPIVLTSRLGLLSARTLSTSRSKSKQLLSWLSVITPVNRRLLDALIQVPLAACPSVAAIST